MIRTLFAFSVAVLGITWLLSAAQPPTTGPATEKRFPPLKVPPGFKATLFACDPLIEYPSVIAIGPKPGAIFVAIDYMTGLGTDGKVNSEVRLVEDTDGDGYADKATVIAKGFNSIQGLAYHDGILYVMHAPFLTALKPRPGPKGPGIERQDLLTGLGLTPEQNPVRLHCANGVTIGHDGWLYLAMGDNGVNVPRPEGDRLVHHGGCILRCRSDGRDLHLFSTGLRNIYDIALDAELNVFTRDNENDGGTYMIRVCHCFHGSDHGYPYLYEDRKDEAMPPIGDFGRGSAAGGVCYLETQFPPEYRGNLFFCEWGKSIVRYDLKRQGSGFAPVKEIEFARGDDKDTYPFKPTDIIVQRDGTMMVSDYADGQRPKRGRGRIYHIAYVGKDAPAAKGKGLTSESYYERWEAQKAIIGKPLYMPELPRGRQHMIWVLANLKDPLTIAGLLSIAERYPDASERAQAIRAIADLSDPVLIKHKLDAGRGDAKMAKQLVDLAKGQDPRVQMEIVVALGRLRWDGAPDWLRENLSKPDAAMAHAAQQTLRRADNWPAVVKLLDEPEPMRGIARRAVTDQYEPNVVAGLIARLASAKDPSHRREYAEALTRVYKKPGPWKYWGYRPGPKPANTEAWEHTGRIAEALERVLADDHRDVRLAVLKSMQREKVPVKVAALASWLKDETQAERVAAILASLADRPAAEIRKPLYDAVSDRRHTAANRLTALDLYLKGAGGGLGRELLSYAQDLEDGPVLAEVMRRLGKQPGGGAPEGYFAKKLGSADAEVRAAAIEALGEMHALSTPKELTKVLLDPDVRVRRAAAAAAGKLLVKGANEPLLKLASDADVEVRLGCLESLRLLREPRVVPLALAALNNRTLELKALECLRELGGPKQVRAIVEFAKQNPSAEAQAAAARALTAWRDRQGTSTENKGELDGAIAELQGAGGILSRWDATGPMPRRQVEKVVGEIGIPTKLLTDWRTLFAVGAESRLLLAPKNAKDGVWLAATDLVVPEPAAVEFLGSSGGSLQVWLNGKSLFQREQARKLSTDGDRFSGTLSKGTNRLLVQTGPSNGAAEFSLRFRYKSTKAEHEKLTQAALSRTGNIERGRAVFLDKEKSLCLKCHQVGDLGEKIGPDLTGVGGRFSRIHVVESILDPSRTIAPSYGTFVVSLENGKTLTGLKVAESDTALTLADNQGTKHLLAKADIDEVQPSPVSSMPDGLEKRFTEDEFVDLIAFLMAQKAAGVGKR